MLLPPPPRSAREHCAAYLGSGYISVAVLLSCLAASNFSIFIVPRVSSSVGDHQPRLNCLYHTYRVLQFPDVVGERQSPSNRYLVLLLTFSPSFFLPTTLHLHTPPLLLILIRLPGESLERGTAEEKTEFQSTGPGQE